MRRRIADAGWCQVEQALDPVAVAGCRAAIEACRATVPPSREVLYTHAPPDQPAPGLSRLMEQWLNPHRGTSDTAASDRALSAVRALADVVLGASAVLLQDLFLVKHSHQAPFPWHQDFPFWPLDVPDAVTIWIPLDPVDAHNGGLTVAPGSHLEGPGPSIDLHTGAPQAGSPGRIPARLEEHTPALSPGDALVFHALTWHRSGPNQGGVPRRAWASTWASPTCRWAPARAPRHPLAGRVVAGARVTERP